jgi:hypothetical protein
MCPCVHHSQKLTLGNVIPWDFPQSLLGFLCNLYPPPPIPLSRSECSDVHLTFWLTIRETEISTRVSIGRNLSMQSSLTRSRLSLRILCHFYLQERISLAQFKMWHRYMKLLHLWWKMSTRLTLFNVICYLYWRCRTWDLGQERGGISTSRVPMSAPNMRRFRFARLGSFVFGKILGNGSASSVPCSCKCMSNIVTFDDWSIQINWIGFQFKENLLRTGFLILQYYVFIFLKGKIKSSIQGGLHV